ncbi:MAG: DUF4838 domain-containing protein [Lentisphaerae bacterium]|nr:DUF4838 domain-containing protein [Lentisphaerota bacterium]
MRTSALLTFLLMPVVAIGFEVVGTSGARAEIVLDADAPAPVVHAAAELRHWVKEITDVELPIGDGKSGLPNKICLTVSQEVLDKYPQKSQFLAGNDGFGVSLDGSVLYVFGTQPKGVLNGVYELLFLNTDIIWARPNLEFGTLFTKRSNLSFTVTDWVDKPCYLMRGWQTRYGATDVEFNWAVRNLSNWSSYSTMKTQPLNDKCGMLKEAYFGHNVTGLYITPEKYFDKHPEYFCEINGKRVRPTGAHRSQLCFSNQDMIQDFIKEFDRLVDAWPGSEMYGVFAEDNYDRCRCKSCEADILLPDGKVLKSDSSNFYSTRFFLFVNQIARHAKQKYPGIKVSTYGYFFTEIPPAIPVEDNIVILLCPITKNVKYPVTSPKNKTTFNKMQGWLEKTSNIIICDYYGLTRVYPRPADLSVAADYRYQYERGIRYTHSEIMSDGVNRTDPERDLGIKTWDGNSIYYWVMSRLAWNPYQNPYELRQIYLNRVFSEAADDVKRYLDITEYVWHKNGEPSFWSTEPDHSWNTMCILDLVDEAKEALNRAKSRKLSDKSRKMLMALVKGLEDNPVLEFNQLRKEIESNLQSHPEKYVNLLKNSRFEELRPIVEGKAPLDWTVSVFEHWNFWKDFSYGTAGYSTNETDNSKAASMTGVEHAFYIQTLPVKEGEKYFTRCKTKLEQSPDRAQLTARWQDDGHRWVCVAYNRDFYPHEVKYGEWQEYKGFFVVPKGATKLTLLLGTRNAKGTILFDDVELYRIQD